MLISMVAFGLACSDDTEDAVDDEAAGFETATSTTVDLPDEDLSIDIESGRVLFHQWGDESARQLVVVQSSGGAGTMADLGDYEGAMMPTVGPDGRVAALAWPEGQLEMSDTVLIGHPDTGFEPLYHDPDLTFHCLRWFPAGDQLLLTAFAGDEIDPVLLAIDLKGNATELTVPSGRYECALPLDDDRIVLTYAGEGTDLVAMALVTPGSEEVEILHSKVGCLLYGPSRSWVRPEVVVAASCEEPDDSGLHIIDLETGAVDHILEAEVAFPSFSGSGDWIVFGLFPSPESLKSTIWAINREGEGLRQLTDEEAAMPVWISPVQEEAQVSSAAMES